MNPNNNDVSHRDERHSEGDEKAEAPIWSPSKARIEASYLYDFQKRLENKTGEAFSGYQELWQWSVDNIGQFWSEIWDYSSVIGHKGDVSVRDESVMRGAKFFPQASLNYAENLLRKKGAQTAIVFLDETGQERRLSFDDMHDAVSRWQQAFIDAGLQKGDRVAGYMPNMPETVIAMLAATSLGAVWSSASPDFGVQSVLDRFGQIEPKILVGVDGYYYGGKTHLLLDNIGQIKDKIPSVENVFIVPFAGGGAAAGMRDDWRLSPDFENAYTPGAIHFEPLPFDHPLFIMFSSGTTGVPKCIVHGHGGTLLQHLKEHKLQCDIKPGDHVFYYTTCGWMMWNWLVSALASEACLLLYDGSPFYPDGNILWDYTSRNNCTLFGTAAKYIDALKNAGMEPGISYDLSALKTITSTGSPLVHESFDYVYQAIKGDVHLASISGGTDIVSCFVLGNPISPVYRGEIQGAGLGMAIEILDDDGKPVEGISGELSCVKPFPCMPLYFWNDKGDERYKSAYFDQFENIWTHGDWAEKTSHGGFIIHGRSDATLNPGGVRIGTAEIYRQVEQIEAVKECIAIGQNFQNDVRVVLFVIMNDGYALNDNLKSEIKSKIRSGASPRHVPSKIIAVTDIPRTKSGKITEIAVRDVVEGRPIKNKGALANPESLDLYKDLEELKN